MKTIGCELDSELSCIQRGHARRFNAHTGIMLWYELYYSLLGVVLIEAIM